MNKRMLPVDAQLAIERSYNKRHIDGYIRKEMLEEPTVVSKINQGVELLTTWMNGEYYDSKNKRLAQLRELDLENLVTDLFVGICYFQEPTLFANVTAQLASKVGFNDKRDSILTVAEIVTVLSQTKAFIIYNEFRESLEIKSLLIPSTELLRYISQCSYLPPMVCKPNTITNNNSSGYLTHKESVILRNNHHNDEVSLDVLNKQNQVALRLDVDFIRECPEEPTTELDTVEKQQAWSQFLKGSIEFYGLIANQTTLNDDKPLYLTNRFDKRGRAYTNGYWINTMGAPYKKACLEFHKEETIDVPIEYCL